MIMHQENTHMKLVGRMSLVAACTAALLAALAVVCAGSAIAYAPKPVWSVTQQTLPTHVAPSREVTFSIVVSNLGAVASTGTVALTDTLPAGMTVLSVSGANGGDYWS